MAHQIEINEDGNASMFFVGETPWHGLGKRFETAPPSVEEAIEAAGLNWAVEKKPLYLVEKDKKGKTVKRQAPGAFANVRSTDGQVLGIVGNRYNPLQNREAFDVFQPFLDAGEAELHTAGALYEGRAIWVLAKIKRPSMVVVGDDVIEKYIVLTHGHDGQYAISFGLTPVRVVCANTLSLSLADRRSRFIKVRHTKNAKESLDMVASTINTADNIFEATVDQYRRLQKIAINAKKLDSFVRRIFGVDPKIANDDIHALTRKQMNRVKELFETGRGADLPGVAGTAWGAYNAATEYANYEQGRDQSRRMDLLWTPSPGDPNIKIWQATKDTFLRAA